MLLVGRGSIGEYIEVQAPLETEAHKQTRVVRIDRWTRGEPSNSADRYTIWHQVGQVPPVGPCGETCDCLTPGHTQPRVFSNLLTRRHPCSPTLGNKNQTFEKECVVRDKFGQAGTNCSECRDATRLYWFICSLIQTRPSAVLVLGA